MNLADTLYLARAGRYGSPKNTNDRLPLVYGDLTDGDSGIWPLPCIDTVNHVYGFAGHPVLSAAGGNGVVVYADGVLVDPSEYAFDEDNDYEGRGAIATVTFTADLANQAIAARGKGKATGGSLIENAIDVAEDLLVNVCGFPADLLEATHKAKAAQVFAAQGYKAAGVVTGDESVWDILKRLLGSFLGSAYLNGEGRLVLEIDTGDLSE